MKRRNYAYENFQFLDLYAPLKRFDPFFRNCISRYGTVVKEYGATVTYIPITSLANWDPTSNYFNPSRSQKAAESP